MSNIKKNQLGGPKPLIPEKYQDLAFIGLLALVIFIFFKSALAAGGFNVSDNIASISFWPYKDAAAEAGEFPHWIPHVFGGMPGYSAIMISGERLWDIFPTTIFALTDFVGQIFNNDLARVLCYYVIYGIGMYMLARLKTKNRGIAFFVAIAAVFSTSVITWVMIGHNTKPMVLAGFPYVFIMLDMLKKRFSFMWSALLVLTIHFMFEANHMQMIFYGVMAFGLYLLVDLISTLIKKESAAAPLRAIGILAVAGGLAFSLSADRYLSAMEYTPYSTRGSAPLIQEGEKKVTESGGHTYEYATSYSFAPEEIITFMVPAYYGFGVMPYDGPGARGEDHREYLYWGPKEIEHTPPYMGVLVFFLGLLGIIYYRKNTFVLYLGILSLFALLVSFGKHFSLFFDIIYNIVPYFNKFRAPSMILALMHFAFPLLAGFGIAAIIEMRKEEKTKKLINIVLYGAGAFFAAAVIFSTGMQDSYIDSLTQSRTGSQLPVQIKEYLFGLAKSDFFISAIFVLVLGVLAFLTAKNKLKAGLFISAVIILSMIDLMRIGYRPMEYSEKPIDKEVFVETDVVRFLKNDKSDFRIADYTNKSPNMSAYYLFESVNGYHAAKMRVYQDLLDFSNMIEPKSTSNLRNTALWDLMGVKYLVVDPNLSYMGQLFLSPDNPQNPTLKPEYNLAYNSQASRKLIIENKNALPRAFFVEQLDVKSGEEILKHLKYADYDYRKTALVEEKLPTNIDAPTEAAYAKIVEKKNEYMKIEAMATGNNLLHIGEIYYPVAWKAYIDGKEVPHYKTNFAFRSVIVPEGKHVVEFKYESSAFSTGKTLSIASNVLIFLILGLGIFMDRKKKQTEESSKK